MKDIGVSYWDRREADFRAAPRNTDPTIISLTSLEFRRLLDIEVAAQAALHAMNSAIAPQYNLSAAAEALDFALHMPVLGG